MNKSSVVSAFATAATLCASAVEFHYVSGDAHMIYDDGDTVIVCTSNAELNVTAPGKVDLLVVGGGGGVRGGGGGGVYTQNLEVAVGPYSVVVGNGGLGATTDKQRYAGDGEPSSALGITALGGGGGGSYYDGVGSAGHDGASGGGNGYVANKGSDMRTKVGGAGTDGQGFGGGCSTNTTVHWYTCGGGGGGAGAPGTDAYYVNDSLNIGGACGGDGLPCSISGGEKYYGGGGGTKMKIATCGKGGKGGGGDGATQSSTILSPGNPGKPNTGGGGGGADCYALGASLGTAFGGNGGSGIVIIRYRASRPSPDQRPARGEVTGGVLTKARGVEYHTFAETGTLTLPNDAVVDMLLVGGGGGGGHRGGGGGGGGGVLVASNVVLSAGTYTVAVGEGGAGGTNGIPAKSGGNTCLFRSVGTAIVTNVVAYGGGAGGGAGTAGSTGGSGGGGATPGYYYSGYRSGGEGVAGQGYDGGYGTNIQLSAWTQQSGGGGGAGGPGTNAYYDKGGTLRSGNGGPARCVNFTGTNVWYAGGGGGGVINPVASGCYPGQDGVDGLGGGGAGDFISSPDEKKGKGGDGGNGVAIIRVLTKPTGSLMRID